MSRDDAANLAVALGSLCTVTAVVAMWWRNLERTERPYAWPREPSRAMRPTPTSRVLIAMAALCLVAAVALYLG